MCCGATLCLGVPFARLHCLPSVASAVANCDHYPTFDVLFPGATRCDIKFSPSGHRTAASVSHSLLVKSMINGAALLHHRRFLCLHLLSHYANMRAIELLRWRQRNRPFFQSCMTSKLQRTCFRSNWVNSGVLCSEIRFVTVYLITVVRVGTGLDC